MILLKKLLENTKQCPGINGHFHSQEDSREILMRSLLELVLFDPFMI